MTQTGAFGDRAKPRRFGRALPRRLPFWAVAVFSIAFAVALSPNVLSVYGIHNDYEMLIFKNHGLLFHEAEHLFSIARPVAALVSNFTLLPVDTLQDFRWTRVFSIATVCFLGFQMMSICVYRLRADLLPSVVIALTTFLVPAFIYSVLNAPAWASHLLPILIAFLSYEVLSQSNIQALPFLGIVQRREYKLVLPQFLAYGRLRAVWGSCLILQLAFYDFPPNALILTAFPVVMILFSRASASYRLLIAARDIGFVAANLAIYAVSARLLYIPFIRLVTFRNSEAWRHSQLSKFEERIASSYNYKFNTDPAQIFGRLHEISSVAGDLWFMPQARLHVVVAILLIVAVGIGFGRWLLGKSRERQALLYGTVAIVIPAICFLLASSAVLGAGGGFVSYRTIPIPTVIAAIVFVYAVWVTAGTLGAMFVRFPLASGSVASVALMATAVAAVMGNFEMNYLTMKLARNETAYFNKVIHPAIANGSKAFIIVDPRPFTLPEDHAFNYDLHGRAIPPYELGCFSGYCLQDGAIVTVLAEQAGVPKGKLPIFTVRNGDPIPDATCALLTDPRVPIPEGMPEQAAGTIRYFRTFSPITCLSYSLEWRDLDYKP